MYRLRIPRRDATFSSTTAENKRREIQQKPLSRQLKNLEEVKTHKT
jgi:hypothetical protein